MNYNMYFAFMRIQYVLIALHMYMQVKYCKISMTCFIRLKGGEFFQGLACFSLGPGFDGFPDEDKGDDHEIGRAHV